MELKPAPTNTPRTSGASPRMKLLSGVKLSGPLRKLLISASSQRRHAMQRVLHQDLELVPIVGQKLEREIVRDAVHAPGLGVRLEAAHHQAADLLLEIDVAVGVAHHGQFRRDPAMRLGDDVHVLGRMQRDRHAAHLADLARPLPGADRQHARRRSARAWSRHARTRAVVAAERRSRARPRRCGRRRPARRGRAPG